VNGKGLWAGKGRQKSLFKSSKKLTDELSSQHRDQGQVNCNVKVVFAFPATRMQFLAKHPVQHTLHSYPIWQGIHQHLAQSIARWSSL
jgi:hypothetical protein